MHDSGSAAQRKVGEANTEEIYTTLLVLGEHTYAQRPHAQDRAHTHILTHACMWLLMHGHMQAHSYMHLRDRVP